LKTSEFPLKCIEQILVQNKSFVFGFRISKLNFMNKKVRLFMWF